MVRACGALCRLRSKKKLTVGKRRETHFSSNEEKEKWIVDYVERETAVARKRVEDAETATKQAEEDMRNPEKVGSSTTKPETTFEEMLNTIGDSLSDFATSDNGEDGVDEDDDVEESELGRLSEDDEPGWVMGTISKTVLHRMKRIQQKQMKLEVLMQPGWGDTADHFHERDEMYGTTELKVPAVFQPQIEYDAPSSAPTTYG